LSLQQAARRGSSLPLGLVLFALLAFHLAPAAARDVNARDTSERDIIEAVRVWPSPDYTRLTIESKTPLRHTLSIVPNPARVVLDIENIDLADLNRELAGKLSPQDPYVSQIRTGQFRPNIVRLVLDLRTDVKPQIFTLAPVDDYGNRLVLDLYPTTPADPLLALENVVLSPHVAGVTLEANRQMAMQVSGEMLRVLRGERPEVLVNPDVWARLGRR